jgi:hypothetical protein
MWISFGIILTIIRDIRRSYENTEYSEKMNQIYQ